MTLLTPNMFRRPEEPKKEDYKGNLMIRGGQIDNMEQFQKDHDHWKLITGPEPDEIDYCGISAFCDCGSSRCNDYFRYQQDIQEWQDNQIRFPGWEVVTESKTGITLSKDDLRLQFFTTNKEIHLTKINKGATYSGPCDVDLFEKLLEIKER